MQPTAVREDQPAPKPDLFEQGDFDALLSTINDALSDVARLRRMGEESYRIVKEEINIEKMVDVFVKALNSLGGK